MRPPEIQFTGVRRAHLDQHRRLYLGAGWSLDKGTTLYITKTPPFIRVFTGITYAGMVREIMESTTLNTHNKRVLVGALKSKVREVIAGSRNRILIPLDLAELIGVKQLGTVKLVGRGGHFEIWDLMTYEKHMRSTRR